MRQAGSLSNRDQAERLVDYLLTQGVSAKAEAEGDNWSIWIRDEDQLPKAKEVVQEFAAAPDAEKYRTASQQAELLRKQQAEDDKQRRKNIVELRDRWKTGSGRKPLTMLLIAISIFVTLATQFGKDNNAVMQAMLFQSVDMDGLGRSLAPSATYDIAHGQLWRLITPMFLHFSPLHLIFNLSGIYYLGTVLEMRLGTLRYGLMVLVLAALSNYGQYFFPFELNWGQPNIRFGGLSGVLFGLFGYVWMKSHFDPLAGLRIAGQSVVVMMAWYFLCWTGAIGSIANWAHTVGLIAGMAIGYTPIAWRKISKR